MSTLKQLALQDVTEDWGFWSQMFATEEEAAAFVVELWYEAAKREDISDADPS